MFNCKLMSWKDRRDLRLKLQNKSTRSQTENEGIRDLREKLSGPTNSLQVNTAVPKRRKVAVDSKLAKKVTVQVPVQEAKKVTSTMSISKKRTAQKVFILPPIYTWYSRYAFYFLVLLSINLGSCLCCRLWLTVSHNYVF